MLTRIGNSTSESGTDPAPRSGRSLLIGTLARGLFQILLMAAVLGAALLMTFNLIRTKPELPKRPVFPAVYTVDTVIAEAADHQPSFNVYGEVVAGQSVDLRSLVAGSVVSVNPKLKSGGSVASGESLIEIDRFSYEGALRDAEASRAEAEAKIAEAEAGIALERSRLQASRDQLAIAESDVERIRQLRTSGSATEKQLEDRLLVLSQRRQAVEQSEINIIAAEARIDQLKANLVRLAWRIEQTARDLANTTLKAPFDGMIRSAPVAEGKLVNVNDIVVSMYRQGSLEVRFVLTGERFGRLQADPAGVVGRPVRVTWSIGGRGHVYEAVIDRIGAEIAAARGGVEVFATITGMDAAEVLRPGAFVEITVPDRIFPGHFRLPETALYDGDTVYVVIDGELAARQVQVASFEGQDVLVGQGLRPGEEILVTRISEIGSGLKVRREGEQGGGAPAGGG